MNTYPHTYLSYDHWHVVLISDFRADWHKKQNSLDAAILLHYGAYTCAGICIYLLTYTSVPFYGTSRYMHTYRYLYICTYIYTYTIVYTQGHVIYISVHVYTCMYTWIYLYTYVNVHVFACVHVYRRVYIHMQTHKHTHIPLHLYVHIHIFSLRCTKAWEPVFIFNKVYSKKYGTTHIEIWTYFWNA